MHAIYALSKIVGITEYGKEKGICRITGKEGVGMNFSKWVKDTFNDHASLHLGTIISNEAAFAFDESSTALAKATGKYYVSLDELVEKEAKKIELWQKKMKVKTVPDPKEIGYIQDFDGYFLCPQRFRTYSHVITTENEWLPCTKAHKQKISEIVKASKVAYICLSDTGQKHLFFKNRSGFWQLDDIHIEANVEDFTFLHDTMMLLLSLGFSQDEIITGVYHNSTTLKVGIEKQQSIENNLKDRRGEPMFDFAAWLMYSLKDK